MFTVQQCATMACLLDVTAPKPGNVHRGADFEDVTFLDFAASAVAIGPAMEDARQKRLGQTVLRAIEDTRKVVNTNTNLGIVLLLSPLATVGRVTDADERQQQLQQLLSQLTPEDSQEFFNAIQTANPGGMGEVDEMDVNSAEAPADLMLAMRHAAERDSIAREYTTNFSQILEVIAPQLAQSCQDLGTITGIIDCFVRFLAKCPDSLIARKCGPDTANEASARAAETVGAGIAGSEEWRKSLSDFDFWLRSDGHRRNPGTTADLVTAGLFVGLLDGTISV